MLACQTLRAAGLWPAHHRSGRAHDQQQRRAVRVTEGLHARSIPLVLIIRLPASSFTADNGESLIVIFLSARHESHGTTYLETIRTEVLAYDELQDAVADATAGIQAERVLELGVGTGETSRRALDRHPEAELVGIDESADMLAAASLDVAADLRVSRIEDELPEGNFDLVVSALAVHHLDGAGKADLFARVADRLRPGGRFVLGDVVVPNDPADVVTPIDGVYDQPSGGRPGPVACRRRLGRRSGLGVPGSLHDRRLFALLRPPPGDDRWRARLRRLSH